MKSFPEIHLPLYIYDIMKTLEYNGHEAYIVGGCTRDCLLNLVPKDWDIATSAKPEEIINIFPRTVPTGIKHGTVTVITESGTVEVTTFRTESTYSDSRHPDSVSFTSSIKEDLSRRDFTMNAIAYSPKKGFIDYFDGMGSIKKKIIYCVGDPSKRFSEDALRMMRAIRFSAVLSFDLDKEIISAIKEKCHLLQNISMERIRDEFMKTLASPNPDKIELFYDTGLLDIFLPEISKLPPAVRKDIFQRIASIPEDKTNARLALVLSKINFDLIPDIIRRLRLNNNTLKKVGELAKHLGFEVSGAASVRKLASLIGLDNLNDMIFIWKALEKYDEQKISEIKGYLSDIALKNHCLNISDLNINGDDLIKAGIDNPRKIGTILRLLLEEVLINPDLNKKEILLTIAKRNL